MANLSETGFEHSYSLKLLKNNEKLAENRNGKTYRRLIFEAIEAQSEKRAMLATIYEWMIENVPICRENSNISSTVGWKNCVRHNLSLHGEFYRIPIDTKNAFWAINYDILAQRESINRRSVGLRAKSFSGSAIARMELMDTIRAKCRNRAKSMDQNERPRLKSMRKNSVDQLNMTMPYNPVASPHAVVFENHGLLTTRMLLVPLCNTTMMISAAAKTPTGADTSESDEDAMPRMKSCYHEFENVQISESEMNQLVGIMDEMLKNNPCVGRLVDTIIENVENVER